MEICPHKQYQRTYLCTIFAFVIIVQIPLYGLYVHRFSKTKAIERSSWSKNGTLQQPKAKPTPTPLGMCPDVPPGLVGTIEVNMTAPSSFDYLESQHPELGAGGRWQPLHCRARHRVAIIIPFRDREQHLKTLLQHIHPFLQKQQLDYTVYVVEQATDIIFNKAMMMNIGFTEIIRMGRYECVIFHDVDMLPTDDRTMYSCPTKWPRHLGSFVDKFKYKVYYPILTGGVLAIKTNQFLLINGFSNRFFGWGGEDDDIFLRFKKHSLRLERFPYPLGRYVMIRHAHDKRNPINPGRWISRKYRPDEYKTDGLNSLNYTIRKVEKRKLYTWIYADIEKPMKIKEGKYIFDNPKKKVKPKPKKNVRVLQKKIPKKDNVTLP